MVASVIQLFLKQIQASYQTLYLSFTFFEVYYVVVMADH